MRLCCFLQTMGKCGLFAPALLGLIFQQTTGAEGAPAGNRTASPGPAALLPATETTLHVPFLHGGFLRGNLSEQTTRDQAGGSLGQSASPLETPRISVVLENALQVSVSALVFAAFCGWGILVPFCHPPKLGFRGKAWLWLSTYINCQACLASILAIAAIVLWALDQGLSAALLLPIIFLLHVALVSFLVAMTLIFQLKLLSQFSDHRAQRMLECTTPGGVVSVALTCGFLVKYIRKIQEERGAERVDLTAVLAGTIGISVAPLFIISVHHCMDLKRQEVQDRISRREKWKNVQTTFLKNLR